MGFSGVIFGFFGLEPRSAPTSRPERGFTSSRLRLRDWVFGGTGEDQQ